MTGKDLEDIRVDTQEYELYSDDDQGAGIHTPDIDNVTPEDFDTYAGKLFGKTSSNPLLDMRIYQVEFLDGNMAEYSATMIAENMFSQCNVLGNQFIFMDAIVDHKMDGHAIKKAKMYKQSHRGCHN